MKTKLTLLTALLLAACDHKQTDTQLDVHQPTQVELSYYYTQGYQQAGPVMEPVIIFIGEMFVDGWTDYEIVINGETLRRPFTWHQHGTIGEVTIVLPEIQVCQYTTCAYVDRYIDRGVKH
jgi:hypothetical protein